MLDLDFSETMYIFSAPYQAAMGSLIFLVNFLLGQAKLATLRSCRNQLGLVSVFYLRLEADLIIFQTKTT